MGLKTQVFETDYHLQKCEFLLVNGVSLQTDVTNSYAGMHNTAFLLSQILLNGDRFDNVVVCTLNLFFGLFDHLPSENKSLNHLK